jgi:hypothetical protein
MNCPNCDAIPATRLAENTSCGYPICAKCGVYWPSPESPAERQPQGEAVRLFTPAPNQIPGQLAL